MSILKNHTIHPSSAIIRCNLPNKDPSMPWSVPANVAAHQAFPHLLFDLKPTDRCGRLLIHRSALTFLHLNITCHSRCSMLLLRDASLICLARHQCRRVIFDHDTTLIHLHLRFRHHRSQILHFPRNTSLIYLAGCWRLRMLVGAGLLHLHLRFRYHTS
uniref:Uncharacterized protein n=1 Tax=Arundo donax TaxID=35708 RepID=A0A0A9DXC4_ARUDO